MRPSLNFQQAVTSLSEYWWPVLMIVGVNVVLNVLGTMTGSYGKPNTLFVGLMGLWSLAILFPAIGVAIRRLHDTGRSGWMLLIGLIPIIGSIMLIVFQCGASKPECAQFDGPQAPWPGNTVPVPGAFPNAAPYQQPQPPYTA